jgi:hypothetical protein
MGARVPGQGPTDARAVMAPFCQHKCHAAFSVAARRRPSSTGGEARPVPTVRQSRPLYALITNESMRTTVNACVVFNSTWLVGGE